MVIIRDSDNLVHRTYSRKRGIRKYAAKHGVDNVSIEVRDGFRITVVFSNATYCKDFFESYQDMIEFVRNWRGARGRPLIVNGAKSGVVEETNPALL